MESHDQRHNYYASPHISVRHEGGDNQRMKVPPEQSSVRFGSYPSGGWGQPCLSKPRGQRPALGGFANPWAVTRVNPEQASKVMFRTPTRLRFGEGRCATAKQPTSAAVAVRRGSRNGTWGRLSPQRGRPEGARGRDPQDPWWGWHLRESERPIVPSKPSNVGGGKGPYFWVLSKVQRTGGLA